MAGVEDSVSSLRLLLRLISLGKKDSDLTLISSQRQTVESPAGDGEVFV